MQDIPIVHHRYLSPNISDNRAVIVQFTCSIQNRETGLHLSNVTACTTIYDKHTTFALFNVRNDTTSRWGRLWSRCWYWFLLRGRYVWNNLRSSELPTTLSVNHF